MGETMKTAQTGKSETVYEQGPDIYNNRTPLQNLSNTWETRPQHLWQLAQHIQDLVKNNWLLPLHFCPSFQANNNHRKPNMPPKQSHKLSHFWWPHLQLPHANKLQMGHTSSLPFYSSACLWASQNTSDGAWSELWINSLCFFWCRDLCSFPQEKKCLGVKMINIYKIRKDMIRASRDLIIKFCPLRRKR